MFARAFGRGVSADHELLFLVRFHLQPFARAAFDVRRGEILRNESFKATLLGDFEGFEAIRSQAPRGDHDFPFASSEGGLHRHAACGERLVAQIVPVGV